jgi:hypothetical protein
MLLLLHHTISILSFGYGVSPSFFTQLVLEALLLSCGRGILGDLSKDETYHHQLSQSCQGNQHLGYPHITYEPIEHSNITSTNLD